MTIDLRQLNEDDNGRLILLCGELHESSQWMRLAIEKNDLEKFTSEVEYAVAALKKISETVLKHTGATTGVKATKDTGATKLHPGREDD
tara:strand:- start:878 stop:1144 length:267 start_codon:yes stop_codon:yes gene_type:complete